ncbi:unnamed protein product [Darwinula stevensoni]|uniref:Uncharacterized protein n=1 Tax=Darwinula stevensoni TaxID=69355 RepID=A0A7R8X7B6_9CRUS|nr:unnamed protein product [Darwinula stevensoni]CAG0887750.1 unnamed protein product [Darwinula stevensoni]
MGILWTALSVALGLEIRGEIIRGLPCVKMLNQLLCTRPGNTYPAQQIERFIDENKALIRRMYGEFVAPGDIFSFRGKRSATEEFFWPLDSSVAEDDKNSTGSSKRVKRARPPPETFSSATDSKRYQPAH